MTIIDPILDAWDETKYRFYDVMDRMRYHTTGEAPSEDDWDNQYHCFYGQELEIELTDALAKEISDNVDRDFARHQKLVDLDTKPGAGLIQPIEYKIILPKPPVPVYQHFITEITPEDLIRWNSD